MGELFGTDGVRGQANQYPMVPELIVRIGRAVAHEVPGRRDRAPRVIIGKDTRLSGYMIENSLVAGLLSQGAEAILVGPVPTPGLAHLTRSMAADAGIMITASHNPPCDNGIKIFDRHGFKLSDEAEARIENLVLAETSHHGAETVGRARRIENAAERYVEFAKSSVAEFSLDGLRIVLDSANGAAYKVGPMIFQELGAEVDTIATEPNGANINVDCGATSPARCRARVLETGADIGIMFDGDADRVLFVDRDGSLVDGDSILGLLAADFHDRGRLSHDTLVVTVMTNLGLDRALEARGINIVRTDVGDRNVIDAMRKGGYSLGGENSGHIIALAHTTTGDAIVSALQVLRILLTNKGQSLRDLTRFVRLFPSHLVNINVKQKPPIEDVPELMAALNECSEALGKNGRHLVRYSGTENKIRILVEAATEDLVHTWCDKLEAVVRKVLT